MADSAERVAQLQALFPASPLDRGRMQRFLRARGGDVQAAAAMLRADIEWRAQHQIPPPLSAFAPRLAQRKGYFIGVAKSGMPVAVVNIGRHSNTEPVDENIAFSIYMLELAIQAMRDGVEKVMVLIDFDGFGMRCIDYPFLRRAIEILQNNYPERLGLVCLMEAPFVCQAAWRVIRPWLDEETRDKIKFLSGSDGRRALLELIDAELVPKKLGGKSTFVYDPENDPAHPYGLIELQPSANAKA